MNKIIVRRFLTLLFGLHAIIAVPAWALECPLAKEVNLSLNLGNVYISSVAGNSYYPLATIAVGKVAQIDCSTGNDGSDWWGWANITKGIQKVPWTTRGLDGSGNRVNYDRGLWPTTSPGIYYSIYVTGSPSSSPDGQAVYLPYNTSATQLVDVTNAGPLSNFPMFMYVEIWRRGDVYNVQDAKPTQNGLLGTIRAGNTGNPKLYINVNSNSFTLKFDTPTCNLSAPNTVDFGDVGNEEAEEVFWLNSSGCVNASSATVKLTSTKTTYSAEGIRVLANTTTGTSAAGGRGVKIISEGTHLEPNDANSSASIGWDYVGGSLSFAVIAQLVCTSAGNNGICDKRSPGVFTASGVFSVTYK